MSGKFLVSFIAKLFPEAVFFQETTRQVVALTIDDVPPRDDDDGTFTQKILEVIDHHNQSWGTSFKVTFFITTNHIQQDSNILEEITARGHEIGNHGQVDHRHGNLSSSEFEQEFINAHNILSHQNIQPIRWFRPGQAFYNQGMIKTLKTIGKDLGYSPHFALGSMIPFDTYKFLENPNLTLANINQFTFPGSILILHGGDKNQLLNTVEVLNKLLPSLYQQGYDLMTLSNLFNLQSD